MPRVRFWHRNVTDSLHWITQHLNPQGQGNAIQDTDKATYNQKTTQKKSMTKQSRCVAIE